jgi:hypothetical protein
MTCATIPAAKDSRFSRAKGDGDEIIICSAYFTGRLRDCVPRSLTTGKMTNDKRGPRFELRHSIHFRSANNVAYASSSARALARCSRFSMIELVQRGIDGQGVMEKLMIRTLMTNFGFLHAVLASQNDRPRRHHSSLATIPALALHLLSSCESTAPSRNT